MDVAYENMKSRPAVRLTARLVVRSALATEHIAVIPTGWGICGVAWRDLAAGFSGPCIDAVMTRIITPGLSLVGLRQELFRKAQAADEVLGDAHGWFHPETVPVWFGELVGYLQGYFGDALRHRDEVGFINVWSTWRPRLDLSPLSSFQQRVLEIVSAIPRGVCRTYGEVAREAGSPSAARAVGAALRCNPFPILIPCHRVIGAGGKLTGFTAPGGLAAKKRMLEMEKGSLFPL